jgi:hypothetical protein
MSKDEKRDRVRSILSEIAGGIGQGEKPKLEENSGTSTSQTVTNGSGNIQISGDNNTVRK